jgi:2,4-dienoyl-CoA reductase-like NADH-dependent reductase (Old Yellow Enzyme family)
MAGPDGEVTDELVALYDELARNDVGLIFTGHLYCHPRGKYANRQAGIHDDRLVPALRRLTDAVHRHGGRIFAQLAHAGSQSRVPTVEPLAPSPVPNELTGRVVREATPAEVEEALDAFASAAARAVAAGFDGVHLHGANGYLISEFSSPITNRRDDKWADRDGFVLEAVRRIRAAVPGEAAVTMKLGFVDAAEEEKKLGLTESVPRAARLVAAGLDALEVSCNVMRLPTDSAAAYVAVDTRRAVRDLLVHRIGRAPHPEAYFLPWARVLREQVDTTVVLVGGMRRLATIESLVGSGECDFVALARPFIREPALVRSFRAGAVQAACTSCNLCLGHEGHHALRCWRMPRRRLAQHALYRLCGGFRRGPVLGLRR